jgi:uncharacterized membrane protein
MPLVGMPLTEAKIALVEEWIANGMPAGAERPEIAPEMRGPGEPVTFAHVERIFLQRCASCHSDNGLLGAPPEGLRLDIYDNIIGGGGRLACSVGGRARPRPWR